MKTLLVNISLQKGVADLFAKQSLALVAVKKAPKEMRSVFKCLFNTAFALKTVRVFKLIRFQSGAARTQRGSEKFSTVFI